MGYQEKKFIRIAIKSQSSIIHTYIKNDTEVFQIINKNEK